MTVQGFGVGNQKRTRLRKPLGGLFKEREDRKWFIECELTGLFRWSIGRMSGFTPRGATIETALRLMREASELQDDLERIYGRITDEHMEQLNLLKRWERMVVKGRLKTKRKRRKDGTIYWSVEEEGG